jgi:triosephosphate isomerase (TIM)
MKRFLVVANWKMYSSAPKEISAFIKTVSTSSKKTPNVDVVIAPSFPYLSFFNKKNLTLGAQNMFWEPEGSFTGEVSSSMLREFGVRYVILGHSERRRLGETNQMVNKKAKHALSRGLYPIICVGEEKRDQDGQFFNIIKEQVAASVAKISRNLIHRVTVAYEPVWAIGSGTPARPEDANEAMLFIKKIFAQMYSVKTARTMRVLYGGSVNPKNAGLYLAQREVGGLLVGKESLSGTSFSEIIACARGL